MFEINIASSFIYVLLCILLGLAYAFFLYRNNSTIISSKLSFTLFFIRASYVSIISLLILNPIIKSYKNYVEDPIIIIANDNSTSIKEDISQDLLLLEGKLKDFKLSYFSFSDKVEDGLKKNTGLKTNFSNLFSELNNKFENRNVCGVILASDGCYNSGLNPEFLSYDSPVYCISLGDTSKFKDVRIDNVQINDINFLGNSFPLEVSISSNLNENENSMITVWDGENMLYEKKIFLNSNENYNSYNLKLEAKKVGLQSLLVKIEPVSGEKNISNNSFVTYIDVIDYKSEILILKESISPDLAAFKNSISGDINYNIEIKNYDDDFLIEKYQLVVLFRINKVPEKLLDSKVPLMIFNSVGSYFKNFEKNKKIKKSENYAPISTFINKKFSRFSFSSQLSKLINESPPLFSANSYHNIKGETDYVLSQINGQFKSANPIIMIKSINDRKIVFITAKGWWRWKLFDFYKNNNNNAFNELFSKLTKYLIVKNDKSLFRIKHANEYYENKEISIAAELYNDSYELVNNRQINLSISDDFSNEYNYVFSLEKKELIARLGILKPGIYNYIAKVDSSTFQRKGSFNVKKIQLENVTDIANHQLLNKVSKISGGAVFPLSSLDDLVTTINKSDKKQKLIHVKENLIGLISMPVILFLLFFLISLEWFLRKYNGLI